MHRMPKCLQKIVWKVLKISRIALDSIFVN